VSDPSAPLRERREAAVRDHMAAENELRFDRAIATFAHPRYELVATGEVFDGEDEVNRYYSETRAAFPDQRNRIHAIHHAEDAIIVEFDLMGTNTGPLRGVIPATGREFTCRMSAFFLFAEGGDKVTCERVYFDAATILTQLGVSAVPSA
jgi:steroid delta-isomerase-like uncharacterized protein